MSNVVHADWPYSELDTEEIWDRYTNGWCAALAWRIRALTGWPIVMVVPKSGNCADSWVHAATLDTRTGRIVDVNGSFTDAEVLEAWYARELRVIEPGNLKEFMRMTSNNCSLQSWDSNPTLTDDVARTIVRYVEAAL